MTGHGASPPAARRTVIRDTTALLGRELEIREHVDIVIEDSRIEAIGRWQGKSGAAVIDGRELLAIPGLVNAHIHLNDAPLKDVGSGRSMVELVHPVHGLKKVGLEGLSSRARLHAMDDALTLMVKAGITTALNFHEETNGLLGRLKGSAVSILSSFCRPARYFNSGQIRRNASYTRAEMDDFRRLAVSYDGVAISGANEYTDRALEQISGATDRRRAVHASETVETVRASLEMTGRTEVERLMSHFRPDILIHMTHPTKKEIENVAAAGAGVVFCPRCNAVLGSGFPPVASILKSGVKAGLGTDNLMINSPDMFREMEFTSRMVRSVEGSPSAIDSSRVLMLATSEGAEAVGLGGRTGMLAEGLDADIALIDLNGALSGTADIHSGIVHRASPQDVVATIKRGKMIYRTEMIREKG